MFGGFCGLIRKNILNDNLFIFLTSYYVKTYILSLIEEEHFTPLLLHLLICTKISLCLLNEYKILSIQSIYVAIQNINYCFMGVVIIFGDVDAIMTILSDHV